MALNPCSAPVAPHGRHGRDRRGLARLAPLLPAAGLAAALAAHAAAWHGIAPAAAALPGVGSPAPDTASYPTLCSHGRTGVVEEYLDAWGARAKSPGRVVKARPRLLAIYANAYAALHAQANAPPTFDERLRLVWDLDGVAHATTIAPAGVKQALGWKEPAPCSAASAQPVSLADAATRPILVRTPALPPQVRLLLKGVLNGPRQTFWDYVAASARQVYLTADLHQWSPGCSLDVCGSSEPLSRTLILAPVSAIDLQPKPDWSVAAVAVHESAHVEWFHRPEVSRDPRLLLPVPNERNAWRVMGFFLKGLLRSPSPALRGYVAANRAAIQAELEHAQTQLRRANRVLGLPPGDTSLLLRLPKGIREDSLRSLDSTIGR